MRAGQALLAFFLIFWALWFARFLGFGDEADVPNVDFIVYWTAAKLGAEGDATIAYDPATFEARQTEAVGDNANGFPWIYPPVTFALVLPLALLPYGAAFAGWLPGPHRRRLRCRAATADTRRGGFLAGAGVSGNAVQPGDRAGGPANRRALRLVHAAAAISSGRGRNAARAFGVQAALHAVGLFGAAGRPPDQGDGCHVRQRRNALRGFPGGLRCWPLAGVPGAAHGFDCHAVRRRLPGDEDAVRDGASASPRR